IGRDVEGKSRELRGLRVVKDLGERREPGAVEADPVVVEEIGILARPRAGGAEPYRALLLVDLLDALDRPLALRDLVLHRPGRAVVEVQVVPAIALRHPDDLLAVGHVVAILLARVAVAARLVVVEERLRLLRY